MKKWIARWFGGAPAVAPVPGPVPGPAPAPAAAPGQPPPASGHAHDVDTAFYRSMTGAGRQECLRDALPATEKLLLDQLLRLAQSPGAGAELVPRVPAVIPQLLRSLRDDSVSGADLARQLAQDVVLVAEVIREANSPYYHPTAPVKTIEGAVMLLGQNGLRMLLARVAFRPVISMQAGRFAKLVAPPIWSQSEKCALAAHMLAPSFGANPFEAYLAGLMQNVGLIVAFRLIDQTSLDDALPQSGQFCATLLASARTMSGRIATLWDFPATVAGAIEQAAWPAPPGAAPLAATLAVADRLAKLRMLVDAGELGAGDPFVLQGFDARALACFEKLHTEEA